VDAGSALDLAKTAVDLDGEFAQAHSALGLGYVVVGNHDGGIEYALRALELQPGDADAHLFSAFCHLFAGLFDDGHYEVRPALPREEERKNAEAAASEGKRIGEAAERLQVVHGSGGWYVVETPGRCADTGGDCVEIIYGPLESKEAAECARNDAIFSIQDCGSPCVGSEVPAEHWNVHGRLLRFLRRHNGRSSEELASEMASKKPWEKSDGKPFPDDSPF